MSSRHIFAVAVVLVGAALVFTFIDRTEAQSSTVALTGVVSSPQEAQMEGVLVSAKRAGSTVTTTVSHRRAGAVRVPAHAARARDLLDSHSRDWLRSRRPLVGPGLRRTSRAARFEAAEDAGPRGAALERRMVHELAGQRGDEERAAELHAVPRAEPDRPFALHGEGVARRPRSDGSLLAGQHAGASTAASGPCIGQSDPRAEHVGARRRGARYRGELIAKTAEYLATVNLSSSPTWSYELKTYPRPKGKATRVVVTEYDLPRPEAMPHDAAADANGMVWYADFGSQVLGVLNPKTAQVVDYPMPITKPGAPLGSLDLVLDKQGNIWMGTMYQGSLAKFDVTSKTFQTWGAPTFKERDEARIAMVMPINHDVDGQVWIGGDSEYQVDVKTGQWKAIDYATGLKDSSILRELSSYGVASDSKNNFYGLNLNGTYIIRVDAKTKQVTPFPTPTANAGPRRGHMDAQDRLWFAEFRANKIGMFDTRTEKFREFAVPTPWTNVYDAIADTAGYAWAGGMNNDRIVRVNTTSGETVEYLLPRATNIRRVNVDNATSRPTFWVGNNLGATIIKVEALE